MFGFLKKMRGRAGARGGGSGRRFDAAKRGRISAWMDLKKLA
jgi:hypothetical protein